MARLPRFVIPHQPQHVIVRGNNRNRIFYDEHDYRFYLEKLQQACDKHKCDIHAYVLMTNHVHMLLSPHTKEGIGKLVQMIGRYYVQHFNRNYKRTGTLWEGRYKATLVDSEKYLLTCYRYIELNPVRAQGMVVRPSEYPWSSHGCNAWGKKDACITPHQQYLDLGNNASERQEAYRALFASHIEEKLLEEIREATNKAWVLGGSRFKRQIARQSNRRIVASRKGGDRKSSTHRKKP